MSYEPRYPTIQDALDRLHVFIWLAAGRYLAGPTPIEPLDPSDPLASDMTPDEIAFFNEQELERDLDHDRMELNLTWSAWQDILHQCGLDLTAEEAAEHFSPGAVARRQTPVERLLRAIFSEGDL